VPQIESDIFDADATNSRLINEITVQRWCVDIFAASGQ
jgi:hypothetical protein